MGSLKTLSSIGAALLACTALASGAAFAADYIPEPPIIEAPEIITPVAKGGWYLRGDITYDYQNIESGHFSVPGGTEVDFASTEADEAFNIGVGIGYQINDYFRVDATAEYVFEADFRGTTVGFCDAAAIAAGELNCASVDTASYTKFKVRTSRHLYTRVESKPEIIARLTEALHEVPCETI